ncbi:MAG: AgmX/PglI C-terminal domain-containing protein [Bdellovibrionaceae bacterium]|nr:AgmX/PglI C-terminal domain-containing protein [Pseudobdellovibrionaceae bacterium]
MSTSTGRQPVVLRIHKGGALVGVKQFVDTQIVIGRQADVQLSLDDEKASVIHCTLEERDGVWSIADLGSATGTRKNGEVVLDSPILSGDVIEIGDYRIEFYIGAPKPKAPPPAVADGPAPVPAAVSSAALAASAAAKAIESKAIDLFAEPPAGQPATPAQPLGPTSTAPKVPTSPVKPNEQSTVDVFSASLETVSARPVRPASRKEYKKKKSRKTFAPPSRFTNIKEVVKPTKGSVVEVLVAWRERIIATYSFSEKKVVTIGSKPDCDIPVPIMGARLRSAPIVKVDQPCVVFILPDANGEVVRGQTAQSFSELSRTGRVTRVGEQSSIALEQGEMLKMDVGDGISIVVRYVGEAPKPLMAPFFDLSNSEVTGIVLAMALVAVLSLYMYLYTPTKPLVAEPGIEEPLRTAVVIVAPTPVPPPPPPPPAEVVKVEPVPTPVATPPPAKATPSPVKQIVKNKEAQAVSVVAKKDPGVSAGAVPNRNKTGPRQQTSVKQGGAIKTTDSKASQMQSRSKDASKAGIFSTFGGGGAQNSLAGSTTGSGELAGLSATATGKSGFNENRPGEGLGSAVKDTGQGGNGKALEGIAGGISTQGRGGGNSGYGTGGLGGRVGVKVVAGGEGEAFSGTIDREAIRRVIKSNERAIRACYERELNRTPDLIGKLVVEFDIGEKGIVLRTAVQRNELGNKEVADCLMGRLKTWRFPEPPTNQVVTVAYPFVFSN